MTRDATPSIPLFGVQLHPDEIDMVAYRNASLATEAQAAGRQALAKCREARADAMRHSAALARCPKRATKLRSLGAAR